MSQQRPIRIGHDLVTTAEGVEVRSPYDHRPIATVPRCGADHVDAAVAAAARAMAEPLPAWRRAAILDAAAEVVAGRRDELAAIICDESAKPIRTARTEAERAAITLRAAAAEARTATGEVVPMDAASPGEGKLAFTLRVPRGVIAAISPFNFPLNLVVHKVAPAIAAGCATVLKPASQTPLSAIRLQELLVDECDLPPGWLNVVTGSGAEVGDPLVSHPDVAMVTFTGSPEVGWGITEKVPRRKVSLELGNNSPLIVAADADLATVADKVRVAGFSHAGQSCISTQRIYVHRSVADALEERLVDRVGSLVVGDPADEATDVSSLISEGETDRVRSWIRDAVAGGARICTGGEVVDGTLQPTVLADVTSDMEVCRSEVFGPVVSLLRYDDLDDALDAANDTRYGLQAAIFTSDLGAAMRAAHRLDFGGVMINEVPTFRADQMPYGGIRDSGNTTEGPRYAVREMTRERLVVLSL